MRPIVVTGAKGSIGRALLAALPKDVAQGIDIEDWDITEPRPFANETEARPVLVYHLAASKDAPEGELDPEKVLRTNALGTANVLARWPTSKVILASTCKACDPETAYGASKLIAERMVLNAGGSVARFHNVIETSGNVFEKWRKIPEGEPLPVTFCHRYFIHIQQAVDLLMAVSMLPPGRYFTDPGPGRWMPDVVKEYYPGREWVSIERRRGDRIREPLLARNESVDMEWTPLTPGLRRINNSHDHV